MYRALKGTEITSEAATKKKEFFKDYFLSFTSEKLQFKYYIKSLYDVSLMIVLLFFKINYLACHTGFDFSCSFSLEI